MRCLCSKSLAVFFCCEKLDPAPREVAGLPTHRNSLHRPLKTRIKVIEDVQALFQMARNPEFLTDCLPSFCVQFLPSLLVSDQPDNSLYCLH
jgi:hypothetical protein